jgi:hypothetical protein
MTSLVRKLTYKQQCHYALYAFLFLLVIIYFTNIKETFLLRKTRDNFLVRNKNIIDPEKRYHDLLDYNRKIDAIIGSNISDENTTEIILEHINAYSKNNNVKIQEYYPPLIFNNSAYKVKINHFVLEGDFRELLMLTYLFETKYKTGRLVSVGYEIETDKRTKESNLLSHIYLQNIVTNNEE